MMHFRNEHVKVLSSLFEAFIITVTLIIWAHLQLIGHFGQPLP